MRFKNDTKKIFIQKDDSGKIKFSPFGDFWGSHIVESEERAVKIQRHFSWVSIVSIGSAVLTVLYAPVAENWSPLLALLVYFIVQISLGIWFCRGLPKDSHSPSFRVRMQKTARRMGRKTLLLIEAVTLGAITLEGFLYLKSPNPEHLALVIICFVYLIPNSYRLLWVSKGS